MQNLEKNQKMCETLSRLATVDLIKKFKVPGMLKMSKKDVFPLSQKNTSLLLDMRKNKVIEHIEMCDVSKVEIDALFCCEIV